jgi:Domain of unknown function (DUF5615)
VARLFADENFPLPVVEELRRLGHDVLTINDAGKAGQALPDEALLDLARADHRAVLTLNRKHFVRLHETGREHAGIVACTFDPDFTAQAQRIHAAIAPHAQLGGQLIRVNRPARR